MNTLRTLLVVAHPDDETLWFRGGLTVISKRTEIDLFCLTYDEGSNRALELKLACKDLKINTYFGGVVDTGINKCVENTTKILESFLDTRDGRVPYNLIITHPFHGGEKPHPHHIQLFHVVRAVCARRNITFGFFSEKILKIPHVRKDKFLFTVNFEFYLFFKFVIILFKNRSSLYLFFKEFGHAIYSFWKNKIGQTFIMETFFILKEDRQSSLSFYKSQLNDLKKYKMYSQSIEYFYLNYNEEGR